MAGESSKSLNRNAVGVRVPARWRSGLVLLIIPGCVAPQTAVTSGGDADVQQAVVAVRAELEGEIAVLKANVDARDAEIVGLKATVDARGAEISGLRARIGDVSALKNEAGGDVNSSWVFAVAILLLGLEPPALILAYMLSNRVEPLRRVKDWVKGQGELVVF